jgi:hypothetical protein
MLLEVLFGVISVPVKEHVAASRTTECTPVAKRLAMLAKEVTTHRTRLQQEVRYRPLAVRALLGGSVSIVHHAISIPLLT